MTVRLNVAAVLAATVLAFSAGCGGGGNVTFAAETDDPYYREGQRLVRQGREAEALSAFLKVIEKRGEQASAESHLEAGLICLNHIKDPIEAIHHFRKYLELQPNAKQAPGVRGLIDTAKREFARTLPAHPLESQAVGIDQSDLVRQLQRENDELRADLVAQHPATTKQFLRSSRVSIEANEAPVVAPTSGGSPLIMPAPLPPRSASVAPTITPAPASAPPLFVPSIAAPKGTRPGAPASGGSRKHTIAAGDTLYNVAKRYGVKMEDIVAANHDVLPTVSSPLRRGVELKIP
jgi:tetratricopeptide (TPR) repeat protein